MRLSKQNLQFKPQGALTFETVPSLSAEPIEWPNPKAPCVLDCTEVTEVDSAGLAWILHVQRSAMQNKIPLTIHALPPALLNLAKIYGIEVLLQPDFRTAN